MTWLLIYFKISFVFGSILSLVIWWLLFVKYRLSLQNRIFGIASLMTAIWSIGFFGLISANTLFIANLSRWFMESGSIFIPALWFHFIFTHLNLNKSYAKSIRIMYVISCVIWVLNLLDLFIPGVFSSGMGQKLFFPYYPSAGLGYYLFFIHFAFSTICTVFYLHKYLKKEFGVQKEQIRFILLAAYFGLGGGGMTFLVTFGIEIPPVGVFFFAFYPLVIGYAIIKYRLMDIRFVVSKSILYLFLVLFVALSFTFVTFSTVQFFEGSGQVAVTLIVSLIIVTFLDPLKRLLAKWTDKFFYKGKIDYQNILRSVGQTIAREINLIKLLTVLEEDIKKEIKLKDVHVLIKQKDIFQEHGDDNSANYLSVNAAEQLVQYLKKNKNLIVTEELPRRKSELKDPAEAELLDVLEKRLDELKIALAVPILVEDELTGLFLIENKLSGGAFTQEDLNFFEVLAPQVATALEKAKLFEEVQLAKENLEVLVEQRTADLKERNHYLNALQTLISLITRSLDFQKVMQTIADGIHEEMNFIGGILSFIDPDKQIIRVGAISDTPAIRQALSLVPKDPKSYFVSLESNDNLAVQAIKEARIISGDSFYDFLKPALNEAMCRALQKGLGIKTVVAVPVYSEEKIIGVMDYALAKSASEITPVEQEMMKSLANQVGIVYRNITLYQQIQKANADLSSANERLKQLDSAKSEFLSIASHQLRTPLTGIKGYLSMILEGDYGQVSSKILPVVQDVFQASDRLTRLVNIFLNVSRIESGHFEITRKPMDLVILVEEVMKDLKLAAEHKSLVLIFHKPSKLIPALSVDSDKIKDVVLNLVDNAIKYTPKGKIEVKLEQIGQAVKVSVKDTGIGMKPGQAQELFKKFVRGEGVAQINTDGSGLGLFIAKKIVEAHGGKVWAESAGEGMGSTFIFTLPITKK